MESTGTVETANSAETPLSKVQQLRPMDDTFFTKLAEDVNFCQELLQVILEKPDLYVVYISNFDIFNGGKTIYHINRVIQETCKVINNGYHEVYVNTKVDDGTTIADLMQIFKSNTVPSDNRFPETCRVIRYFKEGKGRDEMCEIIEEYAKKKVLETSRDTVRKCIRRGDTDSEIMEITTLTLEEIKRIRKEELQTV